MNWVTVTINDREVSIAFDEHSIHIYNAFPIKDDLKMRGYRWNPGDKSWFIHPGSVPEEIEVLKNNLQNGPPNAPATRPTAPPVAVPPGAPPTAETPKPGAPSLPTHFPASCSVAELRNRIDRLIRDGIRGNIWVRGVVASDVKHYKWSSYLDLKDEDQNRDMFFRVEVKKNSLDRIHRKLKDSGVADGLERDLPVFCNVEVYLPLRNVVDVRLSLLDILPEYTQSKIRNQREITLEQLKKEGILDNQKQLIVPPLITRIGLVTSEQGTSIKDIMAGLYPHDNRYRFFFMDSRMEGAHAVDSVIAALDFLENRCPEPLDAVIIARGGGSEQSLAVFNDPRLCRRVCLCTLPVLTAIGHEKDVSAVEQCSWLTPTPSTPSGIGKYLQHRYLELREQLTGRVTQLIHHFTTVHQGEMQKIHGFLRNLPARLRGHIKWKEERFSLLIRGLERSVVFTVRDHGRRITRLAQQLMKKNRNLTRENRENIGTLGTALLSRADTLRRGEHKRLEKTTARLDFRKRHRTADQQRRDLQKTARHLLDLTQRRFNDAERDTGNRLRLVRAADPARILEKGFTLVLDTNNRVIPSLAAFKTKGGGQLKFHDGTTTVKPTEAKQKSKQNGKQKNKPENKPEQPEEES